MTKVIFVAVLTLAGIACAPDPKKDGRTIFQDYVEKDNKAAVKHDPAAERKAKQIADVKVDIERVRLGNVPGSPAEWERQVAGEKYVTLCAAVDRVNYFRTVANNMNQESISLSDVGLDAAKFLQLREQVTVPYVKEVLKFLQTDNRLEPPCHLQSRLKMLESMMGELRATRASLEVVGTTGIALRQLLTKEARREVATLLEARRTAPETVKEGEDRLSKLSYDQDIIEILEGHNFTPQDLGITGADAARLIKLMKERGERGG